MPNPMPIPRLSKTLDDCRQMLFTRIEEVQEEYQAKGWLPRRLNLNKGVVRGLIELFAWGIYQLYQLLEATLRQGFAKHADASWLDLHADQVEQPRKQATKAKGNIEFGREGSQGNIVIPKGRILRTKPDGAGQVYRYVTMSDVVLSDGVSSVLVPVEAEEYGSASNLTAGQFLELVTPVSGISKITVKADWLTQEGADIEADHKLAPRIPLAWLGNNGVTKHAYERWAMPITGVVACRILDQHPRGQGTVDIIIKGTAGIPTDELLQAVRKAITGNYPVNDDWEVRAPQPVPVTLNAALQCHPGTQREEAKVKAEERVRALFTDPTKVVGITPLQIGEDLTKDRLVAAMMAVSGIKKITWNGTADFPVMQDGLAVLSSISLTATVASES
ncbi:baseplate J/gp47 family protein [Halodesulfovibrio sp. MK-HDV]|uniref:baseplate J/gp47 family protein n=1 Tax=Halodesulfovibrio sp. MK-HDV TaxID=2599925 RepID=UPI00136B6E58|nr:baseplate J/gp47 family protein [Halodesulfovibrio sp. MK-HDV]KAF1073420.1 hypothetical protein MKHDV_03617 [Halodesulfovibrio sp. MK-HDV]